MNRNLRLLARGGLLVAAAGLAGCSGTGGKQETSGPPAGGDEAIPTPIIAVAELSPTQGNDVRGTVIFSQESDGVHVVANLTGLTPGEHGFHVHEKGDCSAPDGSSAGGHFNPTNMPHAGPDAEQRHAGDLGNITADAKGEGHYDRVDSHLSLEGDHAIVGLSVIVHGGKDDFTSQPSGNAGPRVACGVIELKSATP